MARNMSDAEIKRRKKLQGHISQTTGALGLTALGGTLLATKGGGRATKAAFKAVGAKRPGVLKPKKLGKATAPILATSAGIGGAGAFNFASYTNAESRKRKQAVPVQKDYGMDMGYYGEEGTPLTHTEIEAEIEKAWTPSASNFDSESGRKKRADLYSAGALVTGGAGAAYGGHHGVKAAGHARKIKSELMAPTTHVPAREGKPEVKAVKAVAAKKATKTTKATAAIPEVKHQPEVKPRAARLSAAPSQATHAFPKKPVAAALKHGGKAAAGAAVLGGSVAAGLHIRRKKQSDWQPYAKRDTTSAFGVDHSDNPNGQHRETEN